MQDMNKCPWNSQQPRFRWMIQSPSSPRLHRPCCSSSWRDRRIFSLKKCWTTGTENLPSFYKRRIDRSRVINTVTVSSRSKSMNFRKTCMQLKTKSRSLKKNSPTIAIMKSIASNWFQRSRNDLRLRKKKIITKKLYNLRRFFKISNKNCRISIKYTKICKNPSTKTRWRSTISLSFSKTRLRKLNRSKNMKELKGKDRYTSSRLW
jgi:hypothetical protein